MATLTTSTRSRIFVCMFAIAACGDDDSNSTTGSYDAGSNTVATAGDSGSRSTDVSTSSNAGASSGATTSAASVQLNDAQIASVSLTANSGEVDQNTIATTRARDDDARSFARDMVAMHMAAMVREKALASSLMITPEDNAITQMLQSMSQQTVQALTSAEDEQFDAVYLRSQMVAHQQVLSLIDSELLPQVKAQAMKDELTSMRSTVSEHLDRVRALADDADVSL
jgi:putative membrane protein